jgi:predicted RNA polymerase sigma factor
MPGFGASQLELALEIGEGNILLGDFDLAEEAMHEAFAAALSLWPRREYPITRDRG